MAVALSVLLMLVNNILPVLMYVLPVATGFIVLFVSGLINKKWASGVFFATTLLSFILVTEKEAVLTYVLFFGYYPLVRGYLQKLPKVISWVVKLLLFNCAVIMVGVIGVFVFGLPAEEYTEFGKITIPILLLMADVVFILYEMMIRKYSFLIEVVIRKFEKIVRLK